MNVRGSMAEAGALDELLDSSNLGLKAKKNTKTVLNKLWLNPQAELSSLADRGVELGRQHPDATNVVLSWGMAVASYPFFGKVAELIGRLSGIQGDCSASALQRRMNEAYGERDSTRRSTSRVVQSMANWGVVERLDQGKRLTRATPAVITSEEVAAWLIEAAVIYAGKPLSASSLHALPVLFPFVLQTSLSYAVTKSSGLTLRSDGPANQLVALRTSV